MWILVKDRTCMTTNFYSMLHVDAPAEYSLLWADDVQQSRIFYVDSLGERSINYEIAIVSRKLGTIIHSCWDEDTAPEGPDVLVHYNGDLEFLD